tara:strand:+ start:231 stop:404 length:174 start_codon:yes stop_codon:yes gene_type:complete
MKKLYLATIFLFAVSCGAYPKYASEQAKIHCGDCPSEECVCIQGKDQVWYISPEVGE